MAPPASWLSQPLFSQTSFLASALLIPDALAVPTPLRLPQLLSPLIPQPGDGSFSASVKCYSLPYGGIGFLSHILTYYTIATLISGKSPWKPSKDLKYWLFDLLLGLGSLVITVVLSILAIFRCHHEWPFILIATWKMTLSMSLSSIAVHRAIEVRKEKKTPNPCIWLILYGAGIIPGLTGLICLTVKNWPERTRDIEIVCGVFGGVVIFCVLCVALLAIVFFCLADGPEPHKKSLKLPDRILWGSAGVLALGSLTAISVVAILTALWSDWILAAMQVKEGGSWAGSPSSDIAWLYWTYFAAKRLPLLSF